jgi:hypothetical protein
MGCTSPQVQNICHYMSLLYKIKVHKIVPFSPLTLILHWTDGIFPSSNHVKYLGVIFDKRITWRLHIEMIEAKTFRTFIRICSLFKSERLSAYIKLIIDKTLIRSAMVYAVIRGRYLPLNIAAPAKQRSAQHWKFSKVHTGPRFAHGVQASVCIRLYNRFVQAISRSHTKSWEWTCSQHRTRRSQA